MDENDESLVFVTIWDCRTHVPMTSMTSSVERTDLDFKISVALFWMHYSMIKPLGLNFRLITAVFSGVQIFKIFTVDCILELCFETLNTILLQE